MPEDQECPTKSCYPPTLFPGILKSIRIRLRTNCYPDNFLDARIEEYTRYLLASGYQRKLVDKMMTECKVLDREEIIKRPRKSRGGNAQAKQRNFPIISKYDPRQPNLEVFPRGLIIAGF